jgi:hypothetical protein
MSGRAKYRKTSRRWSGAARAAHAARRRHLEMWSIPGGSGQAGREIVGAFLLPPQLAFAVPPGPHGSGVVVKPTGRVVIAGRSREHAIRLAAGFFAVVARDRLPFSVVAQIGPRDGPGQADSYHLSVAGGHLVASRTALEPAIIAFGPVAVARAVSAPRRSRRPGR